MLEHVFFDLDHTLWDFERNSEVCLLSIHHQYLRERVDYDSFITSFRPVNRSLWRQLESNTITHEVLRTTRFQKALDNINVICSLEESIAMNEMFMELLPSQNHLMPGALDLLNYLKPKYQIHLISNGYLDIQTRKMEGSGIYHFFTEIITSDVAGSRKPDQRIFDRALMLSGANLSKSIYIGDDEIADKAGAQLAGWKFIHYDIKASNNTMDTVNDLRQIRKLL